MNRDTFRNCARKFARSTKSFKPNTSRRAVWTQAGIRRAWKTHPATLLRDGEQRWRRQTAHRVESCRPLHRVCLANKRPVMQQNLLDAEDDGRNLIFKW